MQASDALRNSARKGVRTLERMVRRLRAFSTGPTRWVALALAIALFIAQCVIAAKHLPKTTLHVGPMIVLIGLGTVLNLAANGVEYALVARSLGQRPTTSETFRVSFLSSLSNLLPIPGSMLVRSASLRLAGAGYRELVTAMGGQGFAFLSVTGTLTGIILLLTGNPIAGVAALLGGVACSVASIRLMARVTDDPAAATGRLLLGETFVAAVTGLRIFIAALVLGHTLSIGAVAGLTAASVAATATGIFPGGLGIREAFSGAVSPLVGLAVSLGILIGAVDRVCFLVGLGLLGAGLAVTRPGRKLLGSSSPDREVVQEPNHAPAE
ncbi:MAG: hypothetical protein WBA45_03070 [Microthrixaceae bacterium]